jgi:hypothetical protein
MTMRGESWMPRGAGMALSWAFLSHFIGVRSYQERATFRMTMRGKSRMP